jgi:hypothetical protein
MSGVIDWSRLYAIALEVEMQQVIADRRWDLGPGVGENLRLTAPRPAA